MKHLTRLLPALLIWGLMAVPVHAAVVWKTDLAAAQREAARTGKPVFVDFRAEWCGPCRMMEEQTFPDASVAGLLKKVICVRVDVDRDPTTAQAHQVSSIPRLLLLPSAGGEAKMDLMGFRPPEVFSKELREALNLPAVSGPPRQPQAVDRVRDALAANQYAALRAKSPQVAATGLKQLVRDLGVFKEEDLPQTVGLLRQAGPDALPALVDGLSDKYLAVRAASYRTLRALASEQHRTPPPTFDPWASPADRHKQAVAVAAWLRGLSATASAAH